MLRPFIGAAHHCNRALVSTTSRSSSSLSIVARNLGSVAIRCDNRLWTKRTDAGRIWPRESPLARRGRLAGVGAQETTTSRPAWSRRHCSRHPSCVTPYARRIPSHVVPNETPGRLVTRCATSLSPSGCRSGCRVHCIHASRPSTAPHTIACRGFVTLPCSTHA